MKNPLFLFMIKFFRRLTDVEKIRYHLLKKFTNGVYFNGYFYSLINHFECYQRAINFSSKEIDTIEWIDGFDKKDIFLILERTLVFILFMQLKRLSQYMRLSLILRIIIILPLMQILIIFQI
jgi:hypothetical protein